MGVLVSSREERCSSTEGMHVSPCLRDIQLQGRVRSSFLPAAGFNGYVAYLGTVAGPHCLFSRVLLFVFCSPPPQYFFVFHTPSSIFHCVSHAFPETVTLRNSNDCSRPVSAWQEALQPSLAISGPVPRSRPKKYPCQQEKMDYSVNGPREWAAWRKTK